MAQTTRPWLSHLFLLAMGLLAFETVSGLVTLFVRVGHPIIDVFVLLHTLGGLLFSVLMAAFYWRHWQDARRWAPECGDGWVGHGAAIFLAIALFTGILIVAWGVSESWAAINYWLHVSVSLGGTVMVVQHILAAVRRGVRRARQGRLPILGLSPVWQGCRRIAGMLVTLVWLSIAAGLIYRAWDEPFIAVTGYSLPYGPNPFEPSQTRTPGNRFIRASLLASSYQCAASGCHAETYRQWSVSAHRYASDNPFYAKAVSLYAQQEGKNATRYCGGCHDPIALVSGGMTAGGPPSNGHPNEGVSCLACHAVRGLVGKHGTGGYRLEPPNRGLFWASNASWARWVHRRLIAMNPEPHVADTMPPVLRSPEFCASCHKQSIDERTNHYRWLSLQNQFDAWLASGFSKESVFALHDAPKRTCNDCHMRTTLGREPRGPAVPVRSHRFVAANTALSFLYGYADMVSYTVAWLQRDEVDVDIVAADWREKGVLRVEVAVTNQIAHEFPTGPLDLYEAWLELRVTDARERLIYMSGGLNAEGEGDHEAHQLIAPPVSKQNEWLRHHELWRLYRVAFNQAVPAQETDLIHYEITIPADAALPLRVQCRLRYRRFNRYFTKWVLVSNEREGREVAALPIVDISGDEVWVSSFREPAPRLALLPDVGARSSTQASKPRFVRLMRYGLGLLKQQRYSDAEAIFLLASRQPEATAEALLYAALAALQRGSLDGFPEAVARVEEAVARYPSSDKARAYLGVIRQYQGRYAESITILTELARRYPRDRRVINHLAWSYFWTGTFDVAVRWYRISLAIDPEQPDVYYNLALCYEKLGRPTEAAAALHEHARFKRDEEAFRKLTGFFQEHPWAKREATLYHVHR